jgi:uncharacterized protein
MQEFFVITPFFAAALTLLFLVLCIRVIRLRNSLRVSLGDGGHPALLRAIRAQANLAEYAPWCLLLLYFTEQQGAPRGLVWGLGGLFLVGRLMHALGVSQVRDKLIWRILGMMSTFGLMVICAGFLLLQGLWR